MTITSKAAFAAALLLFAAPVFAGGALAQSPSDHQEHHPGAAPPAQIQATPPATSPAPPQAQMPMGQMMQNMPEQCRTMMQNMPQGCMGIMQQMMQGGMMQGGMMRPGGAPPGASSRSAGPGEATKAYLAALDKMHGPMTDVVQASDPDVAFVRGMIPHHQGAIDMARVLLQYGKDERTRKWAEDIIRDQQREIGEMQAWLQKNAR